MPQGSIPSIQKNISEPFEANKDHSAERGFDNIVGLFGMPRSGTTIISRLVANHSRVRKIIEPYQRRRASQYSQTNIQLLCSDFDVREESGVSLLVKETTTRLANIENLSALMETSARKGYRVGYICVLRSPWEAFLSQVEAVETLWSVRSAFGKKEISLRNFWNTFTRSVRTLRQAMQEMDGRFVVFDCFLERPEDETRSLMQLFGYEFETNQMKLERADPAFGGDPRAGATIGPVSPDPGQARSAQMAELENLFGKMPEYAAIQKMHAFVKSAAEKQPQQKAIAAELDLITRAR